MDEASVPCALASSSKCRLALFDSPFSFNSVILIVVVDLTDLPDGSQEVVANVLREQSIIEKVCAIHSHFVFRHEG